MKVCESRGGQLGWLGDVGAVRMLRVLSWRSGCSSWCLCRSSLVATRRALERQASDVARRRPCQICRRRADAAEVKVALPRFHAKRVSVLQGRGARRGSCVFAPAARIFGVFGELRFRRRPTWSLSLSGPAVGRRSQARRISCRIRSPRRRSICGSETAVVFDSRELTN